MSEAVQDTPSAIDNAPYDGAPALRSLGARDLHDLEAHTGDVADRVTTTAEARDEDLARAAALAFGVLRVGMGLPLFLFRAGWRSS